MKSTNIIKEISLALGIVLIALILAACGKTYKCFSCGKTVHEAYYDPYSKDTYYCRDCAKSYFAPFPYEAYRAK